MKPLFGIAAIILAFSSPSAFAAESRSMNFPLEDLNVTSVYFVELAGDPVPSSVQVVYRGKTLAPGPRASGARWMYDSQNQAVLFYDLSFVADPRDTVQISFEGS